MECCGWVTAPPFQSSVGRNPLLVAGIKRGCVLTFLAGSLALEYYGINNWCYWYYWYYCNNCAINLFYQVHGTIWLVLGPTRAHLGQEVFRTMTLNGTLGQRVYGPRLWTQIRMVRKIMRYRLAYTVLGSREISSSFRLQIFQLFVSHSSLFIPKRKHVQRRYFHIIRRLCLKDWEQPNSLIWSAKIDIDSGLDYPI